MLRLAPTNTIRRQTVQALKDTRHPYRQALDEAFSERMRVIDIADFTHIRPSRPPRPLRYLFAPEAWVEVSFDHAFTFRNEMYRSQRRYRGRWKPRKHFLGADRMPAFDGVEDGEEFRCAQAIAQ